MSSDRALLVVLLVSGCFQPTGLDTSPSSSEADVSTTAVPTTGGSITCAWVPKGTGLSARSEHSMVYDSDNDRVLLFGGAVGGVDQKDLWAFDGTTWKLVEEPPLTPGERRAHAAAYDSVRHRMVVFGGISGANTNPPFFDTWVYDPATNAWETPDPDPHPSGRYGAAMTEYRGELVLFGGNLEPTTTDNAHWTWNGTAWMDSNSTGRPGKRSRHMLAVDANDELLLYGGCSNNLCEFDPGSDSDETWSWNGMTWKPLNGATSGGVPGAMAYDPVKQAVFRFGDDLAFSWELTTWMPIELTNPPTGHYFAIAYHSSGITWFGGVNETEGTWVLSCT